MSSTDGENKALIRECLTLNLRLSHRDEKACEMRVYLEVGKFASYFPRPRLRSQTTISMRAPTIGGGAHHLLVHKRCPGQIGLWVSQRIT
jgi:hypothetical protein